MNEKFNLSLNYSNGELLELDLSGTHSGRIQSVSGRYV